MDVKSAFSYKLSKSRALRKLKTNLPATPKKRASVICSYLNSRSPAVKILQDTSYVTFPEERKQVKMQNAVFEDIRQIVNDVKHKRSDDARATLYILGSAVSGESVRKSRSSTDVSRALGITPKRIASGK